MFRRGIIVALVGIAVGGVQADPTQVIVIPDTHLRACLNEELDSSRPADADITATEASSITQLSCAAWGIEDLTGIEQLTVLARLELPGNAIADLSPLANMATLEEAVLDGNAVADISALRPLVERPIPLVFSALDQHVALGDVPVEVAIPSPLWDVHGLPIVPGTLKNAAYHPDDATLTAASLGIGGGSWDTEHFSGSFTLTGAEPTRITSDALPAGTVGQPYLFTVTATGTDSIEFSADGLPGGLTIDAATGVVSGVPSTSGQFTVTISATSRIHRISQDYDVVVAPAPTEPDPPAEPTPEPEIPGPVIPAPPADPSPTEHTPSTALPATPPRTGWSHITGPRTETAATPSPAPQPSDTASTPTETPGDILDNAGISRDFPLAIGGLFVVIGAISLMVGTRNRD